MGYSHGIKWDEKLKTKTQKLIDLGLTTREISRELGLTYAQISNARTHLGLEAKIGRLVISDVKNIPHPQKLLKFLKLSHEIVREYDPRQREVFPEYDTNGWIGIPIIGDLHIDHYKTDLESIEKDLKAVGQEKEVFPIINGDFGDWADLRFKGYNLPSNILPIQLRYQVAFYLIDQMKNLLAVIAGDHDDWLKNRGFFDIIGAIQARRIEQGLPTYYLGYGGFINFKVGKARYRLAVFHRYKHETKHNIYHPCKTLLKDMDYNCDVVAISHRHDLVGISYEYFQHQPRIFIRSGSRQYLTDYAWKYGFAGAIAKSPMILLNGSKKEMKACVDYKEGIEELRRLNAE